MYKKILKSPLFYNLWSMVHFSERLRNIKEVISEETNIRLLDLGCGIGLLKKYLPDCEYTGIDNNNTYIKYAQKKFRGRFITGDIMELEKYIGNTEYDYLILNGVLHHIHPAGATHLVRNLGKYLKPEGKIIVIDLINDGSLSRINRVLLEKDRGNYIRSRHEYKKLFEENFNVLECKDFTIGLGLLVLWKLSRFVLVSK